MEDYLPDWATGLAHGDYMQHGAVLPTRDGRRCGNAVVVSVHVTKEPWVTGSVATVCTDMGTIIKNLLPSELTEMFYPPEYLCNVTEALHKRRLDHQYNIGYHRSHNKQGSKS